MCVGSYVSFGRSPYCVRLLRSALECRCARLWYMAVSTDTVCPVAKGKVTDILVFLSNVCALVVVSCEDIIMMCRVVLKPGLLLRRCLSY